MFVIFVCKRSVWRKIRVNTIVLVGITKSKKSKIKSKVLRSVRFRY